MLNWHFARHQPGDDPYNPLGGEHFNESGMSGSDWAAGESLVRECIQNSVDARAPDQEEVTVAFHVSEPTAMAAVTANEWFGALWPHLQARECKLRGLPSKPNSGGFIVVEDFGTRGLEGDTSQYRSPRDGESNDFFSFFRADGLSGKTAKSGGSWGVGKSVLNRSSRINTFMAVSVRRQDRRAVVIGKSVLWHHYLGDNEYRAVGKLGVPDVAHSELILPAGGADILKRIAKDFRITRPLGLGSEGDPEPGLSVVIPYSDPEITADSLLSVVVREYFYPILCGKLRVQVSGYGLKRKVVNLDSDSILAEVNALRRRELIQLLDLAEWARTSGSEAAIPIRGQEKGEPPRWDDSLFPVEQAGFKALCERFERGEPVSFQVPLRVYPTTGGAEQSSFFVYLRRDLETDGYRPVFVRGDIVVPNARGQRVHGHSLFGLVIIEQGPLAVMLRAAEPPSHMTWSHTTANFFGLYQFGKQTIDFVVGAPKFIADFISSASSERDVLALADFFPDPDDDGRDADEGKELPGKGRTKGKKPKPEPKPKPFRIEQSPGGFRVVRDNLERTTLPSSLKIQVAYDTSRGSAITKYHTADFTLPDLGPSVHGADLIKCKDNLVEVVPRGDDFRIEVEGFDKNRDLYVKVQAHDSISVEGDEP